MQYRISREQALNSFLSVVSKLDGFNEELEKHKIILSYYIYLDKDTIQEYKNRIKRYHLKHNQSFIVVDNEDSLMKFKKLGFQTSQIVISDKSPILNTTLGKFDERKLVDVMLLSVGDIYKFDVKMCPTTKGNYISLRQFDSVISEVGLHNTDIVTASKKLLTEIIKLAKQIQTKYTKQVCNKNNILGFIKDSDGVITDVVYEIHEKFVENNHTETIQRYKLYYRLFDIISYMIETCEYKLKGEIEDTNTIKENYYTHMSSYANGFMYMPEEIEKYKVVKSRIAISGNSKIKNLKDYLTEFNKTHPDTQVSEETFKQVDTLAELSQQIIKEYPNSVDETKLLTPEISFIDKSFVEENLTNETVFKYQTELNKLLNMVSEIKDAPETEQHKIGNEC